MTTNRALFIIIILTLAGLVLSLWAYPQLPELVPSHWNFAGEVDDTMPRSAVVFILPGLILFLGLLLLYLPNIDPLRANVEQFRSTYNWFIVGESFFFLYLHILVILAGLGVKFNINYLIIPFASLLMFGIGLVLDKTKPNWFLGIRTPWTLSSPTVWEKTHRLGGLLFKLSAGVIFASLILSPEASFMILMGSILIATLVLVFYSYYSYKLEKRS
jgi:uncharacterized membrane protein